MYHTRIYSSRYFDHISCPTCKIILFLAKNFLATYEELVYFIFSDIINVSYLFSLATIKLLIKSTRVIAIVLTYFYPLFLFALIFYFFLLYKLNNIYPLVEVIYVQINSTKSNQI